MYLDSQVILPVIGQRLVELSILFLRYIIWVACPYWLGLVQLFLISVFLLDLLFLFFVLVLVLIFILVQVFDLWLILLCLKRVMHSYNAIVGKEGASLKTVRSRFQTGLV